MSNKDGVTKYALQQLYATRGEWNVVAPTKRVSALAHSLAPVVVNHSSERYFLTDMLDYFSQTSEGTSGDGQGKMGRVLVGDQATVYKNYAAYSPKVRIYYLVARKGITDEICISYFLFYAFNGPKRVFGLVPVEEHSADIETVTVRARLNATDGAVTVTEYNMTRHGDYVRFRLDNRDGNNAHIPPTFVGYDGAPAVSLDANGRPLIYAALNGHGLYNEPGCYIHFGGLGNDVATNGRKTDCLVDNNSNILHGGRSLLAWKGRMGTDGVNGVAWRVNPDAEKVKARLPRIPNVLGWAAYLAYAILPIVAFVICRRLLNLPASRGALVSFAVFFGQFYVLKAILTAVFPLVGAPEPVADPWDRWLWPLRFD